MPDFSNLRWPSFGERINSGFTLFYLGINIGAMVPPLIAGWLIVNYGWHMGFIIAAIGMIIGQLIFFLGRKSLGSAGLNHKSCLMSRQKNLKFFCVFLGGLILVIAFCYLLFTYPYLINKLMAVASVIILITVLFFVFRESVTERKNILACLILIVISVAFWSLYDQTFTSLMLFADRNMDKHFLGFSFDAETTQFCNPFFIILLTPLLSRLWLRLDTYGLNPSIQIKFFLGIFFVTLGFLLLALCTKFFGTNGSVSSSFLWCSYLLQTIGELLIAPIGLGMVTILCPKHLVGLMMGVWFFSQAVSFAIAASLANIATVPPESTIVDSLSIYSHAFVIYSLISLMMTFLSLLLIPVLNRMIIKQRE